MFFKRFDGCMIVFDKYRDELTNNEHWQFDSKFLLHFAILLQNGLYNATRFAIKCQNVIK